MRRLWFAVLCSMAVPAVILAQGRMLTIDDIFDPQNKLNFNGTVPSGLRWLPDGEHYLQTRTHPQTRLREIVRVDARSAQAVPFFDADRMEKAFAALPGFPAADSRSLAHLAAYLMNSAMTAVLVNHANDLFYYELGSDRAMRLTYTPEEEVGEEFSPDGKMVSFVRGNTVYVVELAQQRRERALTPPASPEILNGRLDWVYQEELYGRGNFKGYWWSPDSTRIAYLQLDESPVHDFTVVDHLSKRLTTEVTPYPKAGDPNPKVRLGVINSSGGETLWVDTYTYQSFDHLIVRVDWSPDSTRVVYQVQDREQTWLDLNAADAGSGKPTTLFRETSKAWVEVIDNPVWLKDGSFLWFSERTGHKHLYHYDAEGKLIRPVTAGPWETRSLLGVDEDKGFAYISATEHSPIANHTYRLKLDGTGLTRLTQTAGTHRGDFNSKFSYFLDFWSDVNTPTQVRLHNSDGSVLRSVEENRVDALKQFKLGKVEFLQVKTRDGFAMEVMMIKPADFDPAKKYPVMSYTYGGPQAPMVRNAWGGDVQMWHYLLAQKGYLVWVCDNRSASGKGVEYTWPIYKNLGELELRDLEDGITWLKNQPYVDASRIGIWGWSYGGYMTSYALTHSRSFKLGIAGAPVTDWNLYDTIYTERYMATPQNNADGYRKTAPLNAAANLSGKLLILHGTIDDNVHMQNSIQFIYELQKAGKHFEMMLYPKSRHGITDPLQVKHLRTVMTDFILKNL